MKASHLWKLVVGLLGLGLLLYGVSVVDSDPSLRELQVVSMADIEAGQMPREGQLVRVDGAWLLPSWVVQHSKSRKRGEHSHVTVALGSRETAERAARGEPVEIKLWMRMPQDHRTQQAADAAMQQPMLYTASQARHGVVTALPQAIQDALPSGGRWQSKTSLQLSEGATPSTAGHGVGMIAAALVLMLGVAAWAGADWRHGLWRAELEGPERSVHGGGTPWLMVAPVATLGAAVLAYVAAESWVDAHVHAWAWIASAAGLLALAGLALALNRVAFVVDGEGLQRAVRGGLQRLLRWDEVDAISYAVQAVGGQTQAQYVLHAGERQVKLGNGLFSGALDAHAVLGRQLREIVTGRVAPSLLARLARGEQLSFGAIGLRPEGLVKGAKPQGDVLRWGEIKSVELAKGKLKIKQQGKLLAWDAPKLTKVRNLDLLLALIEGKGQVSAA